MPEWLRILSICMRSMAGCPIKTSLPLASSPPWSAGAWEASSDVSLSAGLSYVRTPFPAGDKAMASHPDLIWGLLFVETFPLFLDIWTSSYTDRQAGREAGRPVVRLLDLGKLCIWLWVFFCEWSLFELLPFVKYLMLTCCMRFLLLLFMEMWLLNGEWKISINETLNGFCCKGYGCWLAGVEILCQ